jgi:CRP/FNR family cyclic AMP-dependent transcriptional regulator
MATIKEVLATSEIFKGLSDDDLTKIAALGRVEIYERGTPLFVEGATAEDFFVIELGRIGLEINIPGPSGQGKQITTESLKKGQSCGFSAVKGTPMYALTARALEPSRVIAMDGKFLYDILRDNPRVGYRVMSRMTASLSTTLRNVRSTLQVFRR